MSHLARYWHRVDDGRVQCDVCPRECRLRDGQRGFCFVRAREGDDLVLTTYGRSSGFCIDPVEKKPLNHFHPGTSVLSFGTAGCNIGCKFCQNWDISKARDLDRIQEDASPAAIAATARSYGCRSVAVTYNDPTIFVEYAVDTATACHDLGLATITVTAGYIQGSARHDLYEVMDAANVDLKGFTDSFYEKITGARLGPVLDTLGYLVHDTDVWVEITTLLIPGHNDSTDEIRSMCRWVMRELGPDVPHHFTAFHPDHRMRDVPRTPTATLVRARQVAADEGLRYVYTGNAYDPDGGVTRCSQCGAILVRRDGYDVTLYRLTGDGTCPQCAAPVPGRWGRGAGSFGSRRIPVRIGSRTSM